MRVGLDYRPALLNREGIGRYARELVRALIELGHGEALGLFGWTLASRRFTNGELGIAGSAARLARVRFPSRWIPQLSRVTGRGADDLVGRCELFHHTQLSFLPVRAAREVATIFDCIYLRRGAQWLSGEAAASMSSSARALVPRCERVLVPSAFVAGEVARELGVPRERIDVTWLGCDHAARSLPAGELKPASEPYVLTVSRVDPRKNHVRMLRAFELLVRDGLPHRWIVAGPRGWGAEEFERALAGSTARARVELREFVPDSEVASLCARADLFLFASLDEGFGLPPLEAMACGAPVVSSDVTSLPEVLGDAALLVDPREPEQIFAAARRVLRERELAADLRARGLQRARRFTWRACAEATLTAYQAARYDPAR